MSDNPVRLSQLVNMVAQEGPPVPGNRVKLNFVHEPRIQGLGITGDDSYPFDASLRLDYGELTIARDRGRWVWQYTGTVLVDIEQLEAGERAHQSEVARFNREIANLNGELADLRAAHGYSTDNSPALGGQKETT